MHIVPVVVSENGSTVSETPYNSNTVVKHQDVYSGSFRVSVLRSLRVGARTRACARPRFRFSTVAGNRCLTVNSLKNGLFWGLRTYSVTPGDGVTTSRTMGGSPRSTSSHIPLGLQTPSHTRYCLNGVSKLENKSKKYGVSVHGLPVFKFHERWSV